MSPTSPLSRLVVFQYNPERVTRNLRPRTPPSGASSAAEARRLWGAPTESISMSVEIDATDQLESGSALAAATGIGTQLAALEMLLYPDSATVILNTVLLAAGTIEILPAERPLTVLALGPQRVVPVRLESLSVTEDAFDPMLNPIRATVEISAEVLTYSDLPVSDPGYTLFLAHHIAKEALATVGGIQGSLTAVLDLSGASR